MLRPFNLTGHNDPDYLTLQMRFNFDAVAGLAIAINATVPAPNYKDQAAYFPANADVHFYSISGRSVVPSGVSSLSPPSVGPNLDALPGYDSYCYLTTVKLDASGDLTKIEVRGNEVFFREISHYPVFLLNPDRHPPAEPPGHSLVDTPIDVRPAIPSIAQTFKAFIDSQLVTKTSAAASSAVILQIKRGETYSIVSCFSPGHIHDDLLKATAQDYVEVFPNPADGLIYYRWMDIDGTIDILERYLSIFIRGYTVP